MPLVPPERGPPAPICSSAADDDPLRNSVAFDVRDAGEDKDASPKPRRPPGIRRRASTLQLNDFASDAKVQSMVPVLPVPEDEVKHQGWLNKRPLGKEGEGCRGAGSGLKEPRFVVLLDDVLLWYHADAPGTEASNWLALTAQSSCYHRGDKMTIKVSTNFTLTSHPSPDHITPFLPSWPPIFPLNTSRAGTS